MTERRLLVACALILLPIVSFGQAKRPMSINDLITAVRVSDPQVAPDGKRVLFVRTTTALESGKRNSDIWSVPVDGSSAPAALITGDKTENSPRFSPDGKRILFISTRAGDPQVFAANPDGSNVKQVTKLSGGVQPPIMISPDSKKIAVVVDVFPDCKDDDCNKQMREKEEKDPVKAHVITGLPYRH